MAGSTMFPTRAPRPAQPGARRPSARADWGAKALLVCALALSMAIPLAFVTRRICGRAALQGIGHAMLAGLAAGAAGAGVGVAVSLAVPVHHKLAAFALALPAAVCAILAFGVVAYLLDDGDLKAVLAWVRRIARGRS